MWSLVKREDLTSALVIEAQFLLLGTLLVSMFSLTILTDMLIQSRNLAILVRIGIYAFSICLGFLYIFQSDILIKLKRKPKGSSLVQIHFTGISILAFLLFGLGHYFALVSVTPVHPQLIFVFIGLFVFSFLVGYLSFVTPAGLGIREGVVILSIAKFTTLPLAAFVALFTRLVLILCALAFVILTFLWHKTKFQVLKKIERTIAHYPYESILTVASIVYMFYFTQVSFLRHDNFYTGRFDLGNMAQTVWNTAHGRLFQTNTDVQIISRLSAHADFLLILLAPLYSIWESPKMLLIFQTVAIALGAFFVFSIAKYVLKHKDISLLFALLYLINPSVQRANLYDFHAVTVGTTLLLGTYYFFVKRSYVWFLLLAVLAAITKEQIWIIIALFGLWLMLTEAFRLLKKKDYHLTKQLVSGSVI